MISPQAHVPVALVAQVDLVAQPVLVALVAQVALVARVAHLDQVAHQDLQASARRVPVVPQDLEHLDQAVAQVVAAVAETLLVHSARAAQEAPQRLESRSARNAKSSSSVQHRALVAQ